MTCAQEDLPRFSVLPNVQFAYEPLSSSIHGRSRMVKVQLFPWKSRFGVSAENEGRKAWTSCKNRHRCWPGVISKFPRPIFHVGAQTAVFQTNTGQHLSSSFLGGELGIWQLSHWNLSWHRPQLSLSPPSDKDPPPSVVPTVDKRTSHPRFGSQAFNISQTLFNSSSTATHPTLASSWNLGWSTMIRTSNTLLTVVVKGQREVIHWGDEES